MFALRRVALRSFAQSLWQAPTLRPVSRLIPTQHQKPTVLRTLHQSRVWRAEEDRQKASEQAAPSPAEAEASLERDAVQPSSEELRQEIQEKSIATPEVADAAPAATSQSQAGRVAEQVKDAASNVLQQAKGAIGRSSNRAPATPGKILYIGNLFFETTAPQLEAEFGRMGEIINAKVVTNDQGLSMGFGFVEFATEEQASQAIEEFNQKKFQGRRMVVQHHIPRERPRRRTTTAATNPPSKTLFIGNMSFQMSDRDLNDLFREIRNVLDVRVAIDRRTGQPRGFAHADFVDLASAQRAKELLEQKVVYGRKLRVDYGREVHGTSGTEAE